MTQVEETKLLPMHQDLKKDLGLLQSEMDLRFDSFSSEMHSNLNSIRSEMNLRFARVDEKFDSLRSEIDVRFNSLGSEMNSRFDYLIRFIALLAVPIIGSTIGGLGVIFLKIYETLR